MASYTDKIPTFNPYVEQQPIDAMLKVGVYKQQKYEEGVEKIQKNIDNVAGLDIANPVQQKYLQSKLDALGNNLTFVAAGDFSDFSLVNSVNGMTKQITKDEDVINAVSSTARLRAGYKKKAELEKKGLTDKNNDDYYDKFASEYVNNKDLKASFNADYVPHVNIIKKVQEALTNSGETSFTAEQLFVMDPTTNKPLVGPDGHYQYADAKTIDTLVTNKPAVMAAIGNVMNEGSVKRQLGIDGWATYRGVEATTLLEPLKASYDRDKSRLQEQSLEISAMLNSTNISKEEKELYTKASQDIESALLKNDATFMSLAKQAEDNPESFKENYYAQEFKQRLMDQFVKNKESHTTGVNEGLQQQNYRDDKAFKIEQERNKIALENANLAISRSANQLAWLKFDGEFELDPVTGHYNKKPEPGKKGKPVTYDANNPLFTGGTSGKKVDAYNIVQTDISKLTTDKSTQAFSIYADFWRTYKDKPDISDNEIRNIVKKFAKEKGITPEAYLDRWASNIKNNYDENGLLPPPTINDDLDVYLNTSTTLNNKIRLVNQARKSAKEEAGVVKELDEVLAGHPTMKFNVEGNQFTITPEDMLNMERSGMIRQLALGYGEGARDKSIQSKSLTDNQNKFLSQWYAMSPEMRNQIYKEADSYKGKQSQYYNALDKSEKLFNEKLAKVVGVSDVVTGSLPFVDSDDKSTSIAKVATYVNSGERNYGEGTNRDVLLKALGDATNISWNGKKPTNSREDWTGEIKVTSKDGPVYTITNINRKDLTTFTDAKFTNYIETPIQDALNMNEKTKSTDSVNMPGSPNAWRTAYYKGTEVNPAVTQAGWSYRANVIKSGGGYRLVNYVRPPGFKGYTTIYGSLIYPREDIIDNVYKTTTPAELNNMYLNYLNQSQKK
jgi:hypothetical protein